MQKCSKLSLTCIFFLVFITFFISSGFGNDWQIISPDTFMASGGMAVDDNNSSLIFANIFLIDPSSPYGYSADIFKTYNGGNNWVPITQEIQKDSMWYAATIKIVYNNTDTIVYSASWGGGIHFSYDWGENWHIPYTPPTNINGNDLAVHPLNPNILYFASEGGLFKTSDGGNTWDSLPYISDFAILSVAVDPESTQIVYAGSNGGFLRSSDGGTSWKWTTDQTWPNTYIQEIAVDSSFVFAATGTKGDSPYSKLYRSSNKGKTWEIVGLGLDSTFSISSIGFVNSLNKKMYISASKGNYPSEWAGVLYISNDYGLTLQEISNGLPDGASFGKIHCGSDYIRQATSKGIYEYKISTDVNSQNNAIKIPNNFELMQNFPNPFNPKTTISYKIPNSGFVKITIYNNRGQFIKKLVDNYKIAGTHSIVWDASSLSSGLYFYKITTGGFTEMKKCLLLK